MPKDPGLLPFANSWRAAETSWVWFFCSSIARPTIAISEQAKATRTDDGEQRAGSGDEGVAGRRCRGRRRTVSFVIQ